MTRDQIITAVLSRCGKREGNAYLVSAAQTEIALIQDTILEKGPLLPWFLLSVETQLTLTANLRLASSLPADFLREWDEYPLNLYNVASSPSSPYTELKKSAYDLLMSQYKDTSPGTPLAYDLVGKKVAVFPLASVDTIAVLVYYQKQAVLTADSGAAPTNGWTDNATDVLMSELGVRMTSYYIQNPGLAQVFSQERTTAYARMQAETVARENAARDAYRGD